MNWRHLGKGNNHFYPNILNHFLKDFFLPEEEHGHQRLHHEFRRLFVGSAVVADQVVECHNLGGAIDGAGADADAVALVVRFEVAVVLQVEGGGTADEGAERQGPS